MIALSVAENTCTHIGMRFTWPKFRSALLLIAIFGLWALTLESRKITTESLGPLFTAFGFAALLITFDYEKKKDRAQAADDRAEAVKTERAHRELLTRMQVQIKATCHAARIAALTACIENDRAELETIKVSGVLATGSGEAAATRAQEIGTRMRRSKEELRKATEITEFL